MSLKTEYIVKQIPTWQTHEWILKKHYAHRLPSISYAFGLYKENLNGICTFGSPASPNLCEGICGKEYKNLVLELNRVCIVDGLKNVASFFISSALRLLPKPLILVSYADKTQGHTGYIYQATNWLFTGLTKERTDIATDGHSRHYNMQGDYSKRQSRSAKYRYVFFHGCPDIIIKSLRYPILPYPKGDNTRYDASYQPATQISMF